MANQYWAVLYPDGKFIHENPDYQISKTRTVQLTDDINKAKLWQKYGMVLTYMEKNKSRILSGWTVVAIDVERVMHED